MKRKYYKLFFLFLLFSLSAKPQQTESPGMFKEYYSIRISNLKDEAQAKQLDESILRDQRFFTCVTNVETKTIHISAEKGIAIEDIKRYISKFNLVIRAYSEKYSVKTPSDW